MNPSSVATAAEPNMQSMTIEDTPAAAQPSEPKPFAWNKCVKVVLVLLGFLLFAMAIGSGLHSLKQWKSPSSLHSLANSRAAPQACCSPACLKVADRLSLAIDPFSQPCDYFLFTCGLSGATRGRQRGKGTTHHSNSGEGERTKKRHGKRVETDRENDTLVERLPDRETLLKESIREILEMAEGLDSPNSLEWKARQFYRSCMNTDSIEGQGSEPFLKLGGWSALGQWTQTDINSTLALLMGQYGTFPFFSVFVGKDPNQQHNNTPYIQIDQPDFQIPTEWDDQSETSKAEAVSMRPFLSSSLNFLTLLGVPRSSRAMSNGLYMALSSELAKKSSPLHHRLQTNMLYQRVTIRELQTLAPVIDWLGCLKATFHPLAISESDSVLLHNLPYIVHMSDTISKWLLKNGVMGSGTIQTYMILSLLHTLHPALDSRFRETQRNLSVALGNMEEEDPRWKHCIKTTERGFDVLLGDMVRDRTAHRETEELVGNLYSSLQSKLTDLAWRNKESRNSVLKRVKSLTPRFMAHTDKQKLAELYSEVVISEDSYFANCLQSLLLQQKRRTQLFSQSFQPDIMSITPFLSGSAIIFPSGMFLPPLFHPSYPRALNYGGLGFMMAKDLLHLLLPDLHTESGSPESVAACVWSHYISVTEGPGRVGAFSLAPSQKLEVWVQYTALQVALQAYQNSLQQHQNDASLTGLFHNHLFLTSFTQVSCDPYPYRQLMTFEPSFLVSVICANSDLCPSQMTCEKKPLVAPLDSC
ncbi:kell blood group glycoprotein isoform X2 [Clupea harengus]|uniref:Kell blood group glycoprotein isoform X2 n=1 Tax=Clupea harengus TaxID=7950 RepID=A0A6P8G1G2_CLUHA|nr:kell blood group glycoprotein isoform X2 [Clupea harengus]